MENMQEYLRFSGLVVLVGVAIFVLRMVLGMGRTGKQWKLPPGPPGWPIVGNLLQLSSLPHRDMAALLRKYGGLVYLRMGNVDVITTDDPEIIKEILQKQDDVFASRPRTPAAEYLAYNCRDMVFAPPEKDWKQMRRICAEQLFTTKRMESFAQDRREEADYMVREVWEGCQNGNGVIDLRKVLGAFTMNSTTRMLLGKRFFGAGASGRAESTEFMEVIREVFNLVGFFYAGDYLPFWRWIDPGGCEKRMRQAEKRMDAFHANILEEHRRANKVKSGANSEGRTMDFVDVLLSLRKQDGKAHLDDTQIKALVMDVIAAGTDSSSVTNEWVMTDVIQNPRILRKVQDELDRVVGRDRMVEESDLGELQYLRCIVRESIRMHPVAPLHLPHVSVRHTKLAGYDIPANTRVFINTFALGRNPKLWDRVDEFYPERHMTSNGERVEVHHGTDFKIVPFGAGKRMCPAAPLAVCFLLLALARLFHAFDWSPFPQGEVVDTTEVFGVNVPKLHPLLATAKPRLPSHLYT